MGYYMYQEDSYFTLKEGQETACNEFLRDTFNFDRYYGLDDILKSYDWYFDREEESLAFEGQKLGDEEVLFKALAPFVEEGSYIEMRGEDGERWRWYFDGEGVQELSGIIVWEKPVQREVVT